MLSLILFLIPLSLAAPVRNSIIRRDVSIGTAVIASDFPDPSIIQVNETWYSFATSTKRNGKQYNVQLAASSDYGTWILSNQDAMPSIPAWVDSTSPQFWAPDVSQLDDGTFIMYYAAKALDGGRHCVGAAISSAINQPFQPLPDPMFCPEGMGGAIDPSGFRDVDGQRYVVYKIDGNSIGHGGSCNNFIGPIVPTPIVLQKVGDDGIQQIGNATVILDRDASDGPLVEAPTLMQRDGLYYLFYSSNCWSSTNYDVGIAIAPSLQGPYEKMSSLLQTGMDGLTAPGGASVAADGEHFVFHANNGNHRSLHVAMVSAGGAPTQR